MTFRPTLFGSFFLGGFECSTHRRADNRRLDLTAGTGHDRLAAQDYRQLAEHGILAVRDGVRWHLIETSPGRYNWSAVLLLLQAAEETGTEVTWDLSTTAGRTGSTSGRRSSLSASPTTSWPSRGHI